MLIPTLNTYSYKSFGTDSQKTYFYETLIEGLAYAEILRGLIRNLTKCSHKAVARKRT